MQLPCPCNLTFHDWNPRCLYRKNQESPINKHTWYRAAEKAKLKILMSLEKKIKRKNQEEGNRPPHTGVVLTQNPGLHLLSFLCPYFVFRPVCCLLKACYLDEVSPLVQDTQILFIWANTSWAHDSLCCHAVPIIATQKPDWQEERNPPEDVVITRWAEQPTVLCLGRKFPFWRTRLTGRGISPKGLTS